MPSPVAPAIYPVIHVSTPGVDPVAEVGSSLATGATGCFLIDHDRDDARLVAAIRSVRTAHPDVFLGANVIKRGPVQSLYVLTEAFGGPPPLDALWSDSGAVGVDGPEDELAAFAEQRRDLGWQGIHFGGIAFKYQAPVADADLPRLGRAARAIDVPTTSGPGTGQATSVTRLELLRKGLGTHPLALASGVTTDNVASVAPLVDHILVSTGIASVEGGIDQQRLAALLANATSMPDV